MDDCLAQGLGMTASPRLTHDGSYTLFSEEFGEAYHSLQGAKSESFDKFVAVTQLAARASAGHIRLLDICYGLGYNSAAALETIWSVNPECRVELYGLELDPCVLKAALLLETFKEWPETVQSVLLALAESQCYELPYLRAEVLIGDARQTVHLLKEKQWQADVIFLDPFSPRRCPQLWTVDFLTHVAACLGSEGILATYSRSAAVRAALLEAGLMIGTVPMPVDQLQLSHAWAQGTLANHSGQGLLPLSLMEQEHLYTRAGIPLRDSSQTDAAEMILARQAEAQNQSERESTSSWRRRWKIS